MATYKYKAISQNNQKISGMVEAPNENLAIEILKDKELRILSLTETSSAKKLSEISIGGRIKPKEIVVFSRQFAVLISSGIPLVQSLRLLVSQTNNPKFKSAISEIGDEIDGGARLSNVLAKRPKIFSNFYVNVVRAGETSGKLDESLEYLANELEKDYDMMGKIKGAMVYPVFVLSGLLGVGIMMMIFVVPQLTAILTETGVELPIATKILIAASGFLKNYWWFAILLIVGLVVGIKLIVNMPLGKKAIDNIVLRLPIFGKLFRSIFLLRFTRSLQTLLVGGVSISKGLDITAEVVSNDVYRNIILNIKKNVEDGKPMTSALENTKVVPEMVAQMIGIGEKTGKLDKMLESITSFFSREVDSMVANLMTLMEPIIMVVMGVAVGVMVAAIIMPMYSMTSSF